MNTISEAPTKAHKYENNPFFVAINGLELLFSKARAIGIVLAVLAGLSAISSAPSTFAPSQSDSPSSTSTQSSAEVEQFFSSISSVSLEIWLVIGLVVLIVLLVAITIGFVLRGVMDYTSAQLARDKQVSVSEAFRAIFSNFWGYAWVLFLVGLKTFLWTLLFIIPGIIMSVRYSLSGVAYFDKKLSGNGSIKESVRLTKDAWLTTYSSRAMFNILTLGLIEPLLFPGTQAILYRQYKAADISKTEKPPAHVLSWLTLVLPFVALILIFVVIALIVTALNTSSH